jgi:phosphomethylpyrimidine synthase
MKTFVDTTVYLKRKCAPPLPVGRDKPTRINALIGASAITELYEEYDKIEALQELHNDAPDIVTDLSIIKEPKGKRLWERIIQQTSFVAATVPIYMVDRKNGRIDPDELLAVVIEQMESGVGLVTIHPTPNEELIKLSSQRLIPYTSRGGGLVIADIIARERREGNIYTGILDELITTAKRTGTVISIGTTFRPACIFDAMDEVHRREIELQIQLGMQVRAAGVGVVIEGPGHCRPADIRRVSLALRKTDIPIMALGPLPLDSAVGQDHIAGAIGATLLGLEGCANILSIVTREEHTGGVPSLDSIIEAVKAAKVVCKIIDLEVHNNEENERDICKLRANSRSCVAGKRSPGCDRCDSHCPLESNELVLNQQPHSEGEGGVTP